MIKQLILILFSASLLVSCFSNKHTILESTRKIDYQGHRGCRGLMPENTIPAFIKALEYVSTLECDVVVSKDKKIIVSHDPWMEAHICSHPNGEPISKFEDKTIRLYDLTYEEIKAYDCGIRGNAKFPEQKKIAAFKPSMNEMVTSIDQYCIENGLQLPWYDIEIKSYREWYNSYIPEPKEYVDLILKEIDELGIKNRLNLQSFDINILEEINKQDDEIILAYLIDNLGSFEKNMKKLSFVPDIYSPYYKFISKKLANKVHAKEMKLIPWTVNDPKTMRKMIHAGVDGIITDYPNLIPKD